MRRIQTLLAATALLTCAAKLFAQNTPLPQPTEPIPVRLYLGRTNIEDRTKTESQTHKFWDKENIELFAGVGGARMLDYASTRHMRGVGRQEELLTNWVVDNRPLFVGIELGGTVASIGASYLFHRTRHHTLERWVSMVHIGVGVGGSIHNYALRPGHVNVQDLVTK